MLIMVKKRERKDRATVGNTSGGDSESGFKLKKFRISLGIQLMEYTARDRNMVLRIKLVLEHFEAVLLTCKS